MTDRVPNAGKPPFPPRTDNPVLDALERLIGGTTVQLTWTGEYPPELVELLARMDELADQAKD